MSIAAVPVDMLRLIKRYREDMDAHAGLPAKLSKCHLTRKLYYRVAGGNWANRAGEDIRWRAGFSWAWFAKFYADRPLPTPDPWPVRVFKSTPYPEGYPF